MGTQVTVGRPSPKLLEWLAARAIQFEIHEHPLRYTAERTAEAEGVEPRTFAKVLGIITDDGRKALLALDAPDRVDLRKASRALGAKHVRLLSETELEALAPDCEPGALPAVGELFDIPLHADIAVRDDPEISFNAGTHRHAVRVDRVAWQGAAHVDYADLAVDDDRPAWSTS